MSHQTSNVTFHERVDDALHDQILRVALERTTARFQSLRVTGMGSLPDADAVRDRVRLIRAHTLSRLDAYLEEFAANAERAGAHVHFAPDAKALNRIVAEIVRTHQVKSVVKGKSMISEEAELNHALEAQGVRVVETDLGEYIIQLAGERPSHILAPAIHKTKEQVGQLFHDISILEELF
ncbi:MAG: LUD domain-containing protein [Anaerolineales bacterium]|nr:LUD domain-containing protein [Anaerolineales bacterium]